MALLPHAPRSVLRYGRIADRLLLEGASGVRKLLVTSPGENEGKSWVSVLLAAVLAKRGKRVLLIETDLRTPALARILRVPVPRRGAPGDGHTAGLLDFHAGTAELQDVVRRIDGLDIVFAGRAGAQFLDAVEVLSSLKGNQALGELMAGYEFVILDSACVKGHTDAVLLSAMTDGVVLVVEANKTPRRTIVMAIERLQDAGGQVAGLVLNKRVNYVPEAIQNLIDSA